MADQTTTSYATLIDAETWAFIRESESWYPPETATFSIERQRQIYDAMCRAFHKGYPDGISAREESFAGVKCRIYETTQHMRATVVYLHGGGFVVGGLESHDDVCAEIGAATGNRVISVDYRLAPEFRHPVHFDDCLASTRAIAAHYPGPLVMAGDSAGGCLAASVCHMTRGENLGIVGQVLIYPGLGGDEGAGSYLRHAMAPMLTREDVLFYAKIRCAEGFDPTGDASVRPLQDRTFANLPPTIVFSAECDPLADDGPAYAAALQSAGVRAAAIVEPGLIHGYLRARRTVGRARASFARITDAIECLGRGDWPNWAKT